MLRIGITLILLVFPALSYGAGNLKGSSYFEDTTGKRAFEQLDEKDFTEFSGVLSQGYSSSTFWICLKIHPAPGLETLFVRILPNFLDEVTLFDPEFNSMGKELRGDEVQQSDRLYTSLNINFSIPSGIQDRNVWLRIKTSSTLLFSVEVLDQASLFRKDLIQQIKYGGYLVVVLFFIFWGGIHGWGSRDATSKLFALRELACLIYMSGFLGYLGGFWPDEAAFRAGTFVDYSLGIYVALSLHFDYRFLRPYHPNKYLINLLKWFPTYLPIYLLLLGLGYAQWGFILNMTLILVAPIVMFVTALTTQRDSPEISGSVSNVPKKIVVRTYGLILIGLSLSTLPSLGLVDANSLVFDGFLLYSLFSGFAIMMMLQIRARQSVQRRIELEQHEQANQERYAYEREKREEHEQFLAMLTHELRTPLAVMSMNLSALPAELAILKVLEKSIDEMSDILERCQITDQLDGGHFTTRMDEIFLGKLLMDLINNSSSASRIVLHMNGEERPIITDEALLRLVLRNLIDNAAKYGDNRLPIRISAENSWVKVENAPGPSGWPDPSCLFQKYYRSDLARSTSGTGLGLYVAHQISKSLGGDLIYSPSATRIGFTLCLPC